VQAGKSAEQKLTCCPTTAQRKMQGLEDQGKGMEDPHN